MNTPKTWDEYVDLVHQAVYEVDELRACIDEEAGEKDAEMYAQFIEPLDFHLRKLFDDMIAGRYQFPGEMDLGFVPVLKKFGRAIPFRSLLETNNRTHRHGF